MNSPSAIMPALLLLVVFLIAGWSQTMTKNDKLVGWGQYRKYKDKTKGDDWTL
jgi:hypothetical protein